MACPYRLIVPSVLTHNSFEFFLDQLPSEDKLEKSEIILDLHLLTSLSPYGALTLLLLSEYLKSFEVSLKTESKKNHTAEQFFSVWGLDREENSGISFCPGKESLGEKVFLPLTRISSEQDIYTVIDFVRDRLSLPQEQTYDLVVAISEIAQNILEHSRSTGFVNIGKGSTRILGKEVLNICIGDAGIGIPSSLENKLRDCSKKELDRVALYKTLFEGVSRHDDPGRGNGIIKTRGIIERHKGKMMLRSGRAKLWGNIASWQIERFMRKSLCFFPGTQVNLSFPLS